MNKEHPEDFCNDCGNPNVTWYAPNELWNKLCEREEIICPKCFQERADKKNINIIFTTEVMKKDNLNLVGVNESDLQKADMWYCLHKNHVNKLFNSTETEYSPTDKEDIKNPQLWKAEHWRWFLNNYR